MEKNPFIKIEMKDCVRLGDQMSGQLCLEVDANASVAQHMLSEAVASVAKQVNPADPGATIIEMMINAIDIINAPAIPQ